MIFFVGFVVLAGMFIPFHFSRVIADIAVDFLAALPYFAARRIVVAKLFLRCDFVCSANNAYARQAIDGSVCETPEHSVSRDRRLP